MRSDIFLVLLPFLLLNSCSGQGKPEADGEPIALLGDTVTRLDDGVMTIFQDAQGNMWFGGGEQGVYRYDGTALVRYGTKDGLCSNAVLGIQEDKHGNIYFDTTEGICYFDGTRFVTLEVNKGDGKWELYPDDLWFRMGWESKGPYRYDGHTLYHVPFPKTDDADRFHALYPNAPFEPYGIYSIHTDSKGHLWFGTSSVGVCHFDGSRPTWLYEQELTETPSGGAFGIRSILEDKDGHFWFNTTKDRYTILPGSTVVNGTSRMNYTKEAGIGGYPDGFEPYFQSMIEADNGDLWMVTYTDGVWRSNGSDLTNYPITDGTTDVVLFSIHEDRQGTIWVGSQNAGVYRFVGGQFERFVP
jgi:ligand-binding sensor domain-containing protein